MVVVVESEGVKSEGGRRVVVVEKKGVVKGEKFHFSTRQLN